MNNKFMVYETKRNCCSNSSIITTNDGNRYQKCSNCGWEFNADEYEKNKLCKIKWHDATDKCDFADLNRYINCGCRKCYYNQYHHIDLYRK